MVRKCSYCGKVGHNSRTCTTTNIHERRSYDDDHHHHLLHGGSVKLFGVQLDHHLSSSFIAMKKSFSVDSMISSSTFNPKISAGYLSDDGLLNNHRAHNNKRKGKAWSEEEHRLFLMGLKKLGKGYWRGISTHFVPTRTPTQVASHAQKHFLRQTTTHAKNRRPSLFDHKMIEDKSILPLTSESFSLLPNTTTTLIGFDSFEKDSKSFMQVKEFAPFDSHTITKSNSSSNHVVQSSTPDLELRLAVPQPPPKNKPLVGCLFRGTISVV